ncbi:threonine dehydratase biosynthetic, chloroplastic [Tanacetum coccineum]
MMPVGGGGIIAGIAAYVKRVSSEVSSEVWIIDVEPAMCGSQVSLIRQENKAMKTYSLQLTNWSKAATPSVTV